MGQRHTFGIHFEIIFLYDFLWKKIVLMELLHVFSTKADVDACQHTHSHTIVSIQSRLRWLGHVFKIHFRAYCVHSFASALFHFCIFLFCSIYHWTTLQLPASIQLIFSSFPANSFVLWMFIFLMYIFIYTYFFSRFFFYTFAPCIHIHAHACKYKSTYFYLFNIIIIITIFSCGTVRE